MRREKHTKLLTIKPSEQLEKLICRLENEANSQSDYGMAVFLSDQCTELEGLKNYLETLGQ